MAPSEDNESKQLIVEEGNTNAKRWKSPSLSQIVNCVVLAFSVMCLSVGTGCAQALGGIVPPFELNLWRYLVQFLMVAPIVIKRSLVLPEKRHVWPLLVVCLSSSAFNILYYTASTYLALGTTTSGFNGLWLVFTGLVTLVLFRECTKLLTMAVISCLIGVVLLAQPEFIFPGSPTSIYNPVCHRVYQSSNQTSCGNQSDIFVNESSMEIAASILPNVSFTDNATHVSISSWQNDIVGWVMVISAAASTSCSCCVTNKKLADMNGLTLNLWVSGLGVFVSGIIMAVLEKPLMPTSAVCVVLLFCHALAAATESTTGNILQLVFTPAVLCIAYQMSGVLSYVAQCTFMESINPGKQNAAEIAGVLLVIIGNVISVWGELYTLCLADPSEKQL